jgi:hypothetical protein
LVVLWSPHSISSRWVLEEAEEARSRGKLLPVLIDAVVPPRGFREIQAIDCQGWDGAPSADCARALVEDLNALIGPPATGGQATTALQAIQAASVPTLDTLRQQYEQASRALDAATLSGQTAQQQLATLRALEAAEAVAPPGAESAPASVAPPVAPAPAEAPARPRGQPGPSGAWPRFLPWLLLGAALIGAAYFTFRPQHAIAPTAPRGPAETAPSSGERDPRAAPGTPSQPDAAPPSATPAPPSPRTVPRPGTASPSSPTRAARPARCSDILNRAQLGEALTSDERAFLQQECR